jgi:hypothetical protein
MTLSSVPPSPPAHEPEPPSKRLNRITAPFVAPSSPVDAHTRDQSLR